jgi:hypothetical protein
LFWCNVCIEQRVHTPISKVENSAQVLFTIRGKIRTFSFSSVQAIDIYEM